MAEVVTALATTGLRIGELIDLRWSNVDLERKILQLRDATRRARKSERKESQTTKSHRDRTLTIHHELMSVLQRLLLSRKPDGRVFHGPRGGKLKADTVRKVLQRDVLSKLANRFPATADSRGIVAGRLHSFRHYFASVAADAGTPEQILLDWLGHRESNMLRHYYHMRQEVSRKHMNSICFLGTETSLKASTTSTQAESEKRTAG